MYIQGIWKWKYNMAPFSCITSLAQEMWKKQRGFNALLTHFFCSFFLFNSLCHSLGHYFSPFFEDWGTVPCWLKKTLSQISSISSSLNAPRQFLSLRETNARCRASFPPFLLPHWLAETRFPFLWSGCVQNGDSLHGKFAPMPAAYPLHKFKECWRHVREGGLFPPLHNQFLCVLNLGIHEPCNL